LIDCSDAPAKVAVTEVAEFEEAFRTSVQVAEDPEHAPDHPLKEPPEAGAAVSVTLVPEGNAALQVEPQFMPAGLLVTVPDPVLETLNCTVAGCGWGCGACGCGCDEFETPPHPTRRMVYKPNNAAEILTEKDTDLYPQDYFSMAA
jgi:hypothetical protein